MARGVATPEVGVRRVTVEFIGRVPQTSEVGNLTSDSYPRSHRTADWGVPFTTIPRLIDDKHHTGWLRICGK